MTDQTLFSPEAQPMAPRRRGACPTLDAPMRTGDGLLARVRVAGGRLSPGELAAVARLAGAHGNGLVEVTARGNLQVRGLSAESAPMFAAGVRAVLAIETGLTVDLSPIAGEDPEELGDATALARAIRTGAAGFAERLGPKVSVVVDGGGQISLAALKADVRLLALGGGRWAVTLGGGKAQTMDGETAVAATLALLGSLAALGPEARGVDLFPGDAAARHRDAAADVGAGMVFRRRGGWSQAIALPFGQIPVGALIGLAERAADGVERIRLAPGHRLLLDGASAALIAEAEGLGFVTDGGDPRLRVSACSGTDGCASGHIAARRLGSALAALVPAGQHLHVSGCAKGCAHPRAADVTLVGREDGIGLVFDGRAGDTPSQICDEAGLIPALVARREGR